MKVYIGPYLTWIGPYQIADVLQYVGVSEDKCFAIGEWLSNTWVGTFCQWVESKRHRTVKVRIDKYDVWGMDSTLAYMILPMLKMLKQNKHGAPFVDDVDVPDNLKSTAAEPKENEWDVDSNHFLRWDYVMDEMIWTFERIHPESRWEQPYYDNEITVEEYTALGNRMKVGTTLFGKYFLNLWD
jgi:hypothetical protein